MDKASFEKLKNKLIQARKELAGDVEKSRQYSNEEVVGEVPDINDDATRTYSRQVILQLGESERKRLKEVDEAINRFESNNYGFCTECGDDIPFARLNLIPYAKYCVCCQEKIEGITNSFDSDISDSSLS